MTHEATSAVADTLPNLFAGDTAVDHPLGSSFWDLSAADRLSDVCSAADHGDAFHVGKEFSDVRAAIDCVQRNALKKRKQLNDEVRSSKYRKLVCADNTCGFYVLLTNKDGTWRVERTGLPHAVTCTSVGKPVPRHLAQLPEFQDAVEKNSTASDAKLAKIVQDRTGLIVGSSTAGTARKLVAPHNQTTQAGGNSTVQDSHATAGAESHQRGPINASLQSCEGQTLRNELSTPSPTVASQRLGQPCTSTVASISPRSVEQADISLSIGGHSPFHPLSDGIAAGMADGATVAVSACTEATRPTHQADKRPASAARMANDDPSKRQRIPTMYSAMVEHYREARRQRMEREMRLLRDACDKFAYIARHTNLWEVFPTRLVQEGDSLLSAMADVMTDRTYGFFSCIGTTAEHDAIARAKILRLRLNAHVNEYKKQRSSNIGNVTFGRQIEILCGLNQSTEQSGATPPPPERWGDELYIKAAVLMDGHPFTVFDQQADGDVIAHVYYQDKYKPGTVDSVTISAAEACEFVKSLTNEAVVPYVLALRRDSGGGVFSALRVDDDTYKEWASTQEKRDRMKQRADEIVQQWAQHWRQLSQQ